MDIENLELADRAAIRALQRVGLRWGRNLRLVSAGGALGVAWSDGKSPDELIAVIPGIPLGGEWPRERAGGRWWYEFTPERGDAEYAKLEPAVRLLLQPTLGRRRRLSFDEAGWDEFRESAARCGIALRDVQRTPAMPAEDVR
jgi:hypothetical protein